MLKILILTLNNLFLLNQVNQQDSKGGAIDKLMNKIYARSKSILKYRKTKPNEELMDDNENKIHQLIENARERGKSLAKAEWSSRSKSNKSIKRNVSTKLLTKKSWAAKNLLLEW